MRRDDEDSAQETLDRLRAATGIVLVMVLTFSAALVADLLALRWLGY